MRNSFFFTFYALRFTFHQLVEESTYVSSPGSSRARHAADIGLALGDVELPGGGAGGAAAARARSRGIPQRRRVGILAAALRCLSASATRARLGHHGTQYPPWYYDDVVGEHRPAAARSTERLGAAAGSVLRGLSDADAPADSPD